MFFSKHVVSILVLYSIFKMVHEYDRMKKKSFRIQIHLKITIFYVVYLKKNILFLSFDLIYVSRRQQRLRNRTELLKKGTNHKKIL